MTTAPPELGQPAPRPNEPHPATAGIQATRPHNLTAPAAVRPDDLQAARTGGDAAWRRLASPRSKGRVRGALRRIDEAAPHRDRAVDALRAFAILGVVLGHWLVTALAPGGGTRSPLAYLPGLVPLTWLLQTLAVFFLVGGYSGAVGLRPPYGAWLRRRMTRLLRPAMVLVAVWLPFTLVGGPVRLALNPLWFLGVYAGLTALTPLLARLPTRAVAAPVAIVAGADLVRYALDGPAWIGWVNVPAAWSVPYLLGMAWARGGLGGRAAWAMLAGGGAAAVALVTLAGYPASMVGVPGQAISNLDPPTLAAVAFGVAQAGLALLLRRPLARWMRRPAAWAAVALVNLAAMTVYCWHQTALILVTACGRVFGALPGLHDVPDRPSWVLHRLAWLPAFAAVLAVCLAVFRRFERPR
jgi:Acyltransferase family